MTLLSRRRPKSKHVLPVFFLLLRLALAEEIVDFLGRIDATHERKSVLVISIEFLLFVPWWAVP